MDFVFDRAKRSLACVFSCYSTTTRIYTVMLSNFEYRYHDFFPSIIPMSQVCTIFSRHMQILQGSHVSMCAVPEGSDDGAAVPVDPHLPNASRCPLAATFLPSASGRPHISNTLLRRCAGGACIVIFQKKILYFIVWLARLCFACGRKKTKPKKSFSTIYCT